MSTHLTSAAALAALARNADGAPFKELFAHGTLSVEVYKPIGVDHQSVHDRDEVYVVIAGRGRTAPPGAGLARADHRHARQGHPDRLRPHLQAGREAA
jgi:hypothetical protein